MAVSRKEVEARAAAGSGGPAVSRAGEELPLVRVMRDDGTADASAMPALSEGEIRRLYETMVLNRVLDERLTTLQRQGRIGFHIGSVGEEAAIIGAAFALEPSDWLFPCYREAGAGLVRGMPLQRFVNNMFGNAEDPVKGRQMPCHWYDREHNMPSISSPIGTQITHAVGAAMAARIKGDKTVCLVYFGEGASSSNEFHVGANFAGVFKAPAILFCRNNQWAISVPFERQTGSASIAIKALAYGIEGVRVDGNDVFAVIKVTREAMARARRGEGATLVEAYSYRLSGHSTSDDPRAYRKDSEVEPWRKKDPIDRLRRFLEKKGWIDAGADRKLRDDCTARVLAAVETAEKLPPPPLESLFEDVFETMPPRLAAQLEELKAAPRWKGH